MNHQIQGLSIHAEVHGTAEPAAYAFEFFGLYIRGSSPVDVFTYAPDGLSATRTVLAPKAIGSSLPPHGRITQTVERGAYGAGLSPQNEPHPIT